jgi:GTPase SAR1 family protein
VPHTFG